MRSTGIVRKTDPLGRIVIPKELRRGMDINVGAPLAIYVDEDQIILKHYQPQNICLVTGEIANENLSLADGKIHLSKESAKELLKELEEFLQTH